MILIPNTIDFTNLRRLAEIVADLRDRSDNQKEFSTGLTMIRKKAKEAGRRKECDELFERIAEVIDDYEIRFDYDFEDYSETDKPYWDVFNQKTQLERDQRLEVLTAAAKDVGYKSFKKSYKAFLLNLRKLNVQVEGTAAQNPTRFPDQPLELDAGEWRCDYNGVVREKPNGAPEVACLHPILPVERFTNIDTGEEKLRIAYYDNKRWRELIIGKKEAFDSTKVMQLAAYGVSVTSSSSKSLSSYLCDMEGKNKGVIPETKSVARLGYIGDGEGFSPYVEDLIFDGDANYGNIYAAITQKGDYTKWLSEAVKCRTDSLTAQIMLAASFASPLIGKIGCLPFFVHLWGVESGTGKTVALMLAASVWGDPSVGSYIQTFNSTQVGLEKTAAFLNNVPLCVDELQLSKDSHGKSRFDVYQLAQGVGRTRGNKGGGIDKTPTWSLCVLTTGESPLTTDSAGAGAINRVIDIECKAADSVIKDGFCTSSTVKQNYGYAGKAFIEALEKEDFEKLTDKYQFLLKELLSGSTTEKQAMAAAILIIADELADKYIFKTGKHLTVDNLKEFLKDKSSVSAGERGYSYICDWLSANSNKFMYRNPEGGIEKPGGDLYGMLEGNWAYINNSVFRKAVKDAGYDDRALLSWLKTNGLIDVRGRRFTRGKRINGVLTECVVLSMPDEFGDSGEFVELI